MSIDYDVALICMNGHVVNSHVRDYPERNTKHCEDCGLETIDKCPGCSTPIRGAPRRVMGDIEPPRYCAECGKAFPWTSSAIEAAKEYADILESISGSEKDEIKLQIEELVKDSPRQQVAIAKFQRIAAKAGKAALDGFGKILVSVVTEMAKKAIWPT